jgi:tripartite-type tricarboxylate transporter receptor subunit TctC
MASAVAQVVGTGIQVINRPGSGGRAAIADFMAAPADGYTVMEHIDDAATLYASGKIKENPAKDWTPLAIAQITFDQIYIRPDDQESLQRYWPHEVGYLRKKRNILTAVQDNWNLRSVSSRS